MKDVIYNPASEKHKKPFGAIPSEEYATFSIDIKNDLFPDEVFFVVRPDEGADSIYNYMDKIATYDDYTTFSCKANFDTPGLYFYRFEIKCGDFTRFVGLKDNEAFIEDWLPEWQLTVYDKNFKTPRWVKGAIMYQIFPDRFAKSDSFSVKPSKNERKMHKDWFEIPEFIYDTPNYKANDYFGGNIQGVIEKIDYLKSLGVDIIYFNPVFESPEYHRYSTADYFNIDPYFGTNDDFKLLCQKCKDVGIRVILDGVFSHTGADSIYFNKFGHYDSVGAANSKDSLYYNWYDFIEYPDKYHSWWGFENLPNVNETTPSYMEYITGKDGVINFWQNIGCSGWRLDVADELPDEFIEALYASSKSNNNDSFIIGEVWEDATNKFAYGKRRRYLLGSQMDSVMNYPWRHAILEFIKNGNEKLFNQRIFAIAENYPPDVLNSLMNSLSTHDTFRAINYLGVEKDIPKEEYGKYTLTEEEYKRGKERLFFATFLQFTLPGIPCIYYGDEVGLDGFSDPYCRKTYPYGKEDYEILNFFKTLSKTRKKYRNDFSSSFKVYETYNSFYSFERGNLICGINLSNKEIELNLSGELLFCYGKCEEKAGLITSYPKSAFIIKK